MKSKLIAAALILASGIAVAQETTKTFTLTLEEPEILYIARVLRERPYNEVAALLNKIQEQINKQETPTEPEK